MNQSPDLKGPSNNKPAHILFVDDEEMLTDMVDDIFPLMGFNVTVTTDPDEAIELLKKNRALYDVLITDQSMPYMSGIELAEQALKLMPELPIILCTGYSDWDETELNEKTGIKKLCSKPVTQKKLSKVIHEVLG